MDRPFAAYTGDEPYIFVSYSHKDSDAVFPEITRLNDQGINIWYDEGIEAGAEWTEALATAITGAKLFVYFVTPDSAQSQNCRNEVNFAVEQKVSIVSVHLKKTDLPGGLSLTLSSRQAILKHEIPANEYEQKLLSGISSYLNQAGARPPSIPASGSGVARKKTLSMIAGGLLVLLAVAVGTFYLQQTSQQSVDTIVQQPSEDLVAEPQVDLARELSIEVRPFTLIGASDKAGSLAQSMVELIAEGIVGRLALQSIAAADDDIRVLSPSLRTSLSLANNDSDARLQVAYLLESNIRQIDENIRLAVQIIRVKDGAQIWADNFDMAADAGFKSQTRVSNAIAGKARLELFKDVVKENPDGFIAFKGINPDAVKLYFDADYRKPPKVRVQLYEAALELDPNFARAYAMLGNTYRLDSSLPREERLEKALAANDEANALQQDEYFIWTLRGAIFRDLFDYPMAIDAIEKAMALNIQYSGWSNLSLAGIAMQEGRVDDALEKLATGAAMAGDNSGLGISHAYMLIVAGQYQQALTLLEHELDEEIIGGNAERRQRNISWQINALNYLGETDRAQALIAANPEAASTPQVMLLNAKNEDFLDFIEGAFQGDTGVLVMLRAAPSLDRLREEPRFIKLLERLDSLETHTEKYLLDRDAKEETRL